MKLISWNVNGLRRFRREPKMTFFTFYIFINQFQI